MNQMFSAISVANPLYSIKGKQSVIL